MLVYTPPGYSADKKYPVIYLLHGLNSAAAKEKLKLLWLGCGSKDGLIGVSQGVHQFIKEQEIPHVWHVDGNAHDDSEWANNLYLFVRHIFEE